MSTTQGRFHHYIPQFILRSFIPEDETTSSPSTPRTKKQRQKASRKARKKGLDDPESITLFDMTTKTIRSTSIRRTFGVHNFYEDVLHPENMEHLEQKLSVLEREAARIIAGLHRAASKPTSKLTLSLPRSDQHILRKFIFVMHYRSNAVDTTYFQEDHPRNAPSREWIRRLKREKGFTSDRELWLDGLNYYLETPHQDILDHAEASAASNRRIGEVDPRTPSEHYHSQAYKKLYNDYYMGIWKADSQSEFVLGENSYGLWEGTLAVSPQLFRIYVLSPQIVLVLKLNLSKGPLSPLEISTLSSHPLDLPRTTYNNPPAGLRDQRASPYAQHDALQSHLRSKNAQKDLFTFTIHPLNRRQTYLVNQVVLENLRPDGKLVFSSHTAMLETSRLYDTPEGPFGKANRRAIAALIQGLLNPKPINPLGPDASDSTGGQQEQSGEPHSSVILLDRAFLEGRSIAIPEIDMAFDDMLIDIIEGSIEFESEYSRALYVANLSPPLNFSIHPLVKEVQERIMRLPEMIEVLNKMVPDDILEKKKHLDGQRLQLVQTLEKDDSDHLLRLVYLHMEPWSRDWVEFDPLKSKSLDQRILDQVTAVAYLNLLLDKAPVVAASICMSVDFIEISTRGGLNPQSRVEEESKAPLALSSDSRQRDKVGLDIMEPKIETAAAVAEEELKNIKRRRPGKDAEAGSNRDAHPVVELDTGHGLDPPSRGNGLGQLVAPLDRLYEIGYVFLAIVSILCVGVVGLAVRFAESLLELLVPGGAAEDESEVQRELGRVSPALSLPSSL